MLAALRARPWKRRVPESALAEVSSILGVEELPVFVTILGRARIYVNDPVTVLAMSHPKFPLM